MPFLKSDQNPNGSIISLSDLYLSICYGMRYEPASGYWLSNADFYSFTPDTDKIGSQIRYYLQVPDIEEIMEPIEPEDEGNEEEEEGDGEEGDFEEELLYEEGGLEEEENEETE